MGCAVEWGDSKLCYDLQRQTAGFRGRKCLAALVGLVIYYAELGKFAWTCLYDMMWLFCFLNDC